MMYKYVVHAYRYMYTYLFRLIDVSQAGQSRVNHNFTASRDP